MQCDGFQEGISTGGFLEQCSCTAKWSVTNKSETCNRNVCGRHVQTFRHAIKQGFDYTIKEVHNGDKPWSSCNPPPDMCDTCTLNPDTCESKDREFHNGDVGVDNVIKCSLYTTGKLK